MSSPASVVYLTTPTSGTTSIWLLLLRLCEAYAHKVKVAEQYLNEGRLKELEQWVPEPTGHVYMYNAPQVVAAGMGAAPKLIVSFRDPRDLACNQFHWAQQHPILDKPQAEVDAWRDSVRSKGIDQYVLGADNNVLFKSFMAISDRIQNDREFTLVISYAQLCLDFDEMVKRVARFVGLDEARIPWAAIEPLRAEKLTTHPGWVGHRWTGSDTTPGRHRAELQPATIAKLDDRYRDVLKFIRGLETPSLRHYLATAREREEMSRVVVGRDDELFLTKDANDVMGQVTGRRPMARADLFRIATAHRARRQFGATVGDFTYEHMVIPNKECALKDYLPPEFVFEGEGPRPLTQFLQSPAARIWRPFYEAELLQPTGQHRYFSRTDTHWNHSGALRYFSAFIGRQVPQLQAPLEALALRRFTGQQMGDLGSKLELPAEPIEIVTPQRAQARMLFENGISNEGCIRWYRNANAPTGHRVIVLHDSFTQWLLAIIPELFAEVLFFHGTIFDYEVMEKFKPSMVLCLQVERFFNRVPDTGGNMLQFVDDEEKKKTARQRFADFWQDHLPG